MTRKEILDYISNLDISNVLIYDIKKYVNMFFVKYFDIADLYKEGNYYNPQLDELNKLYIKTVSYIYALLRAGILKGDEFSEIEGLLWGMYSSMEVD